MSFPQNTPASQNLPAHLKSVIKTLVVGVFLTTSFMTFANHELSEPTDGTVRSFRPVNQRPSIPPVTFFESDIQPVNIQTFHGKIVLVNLWATWCGPCRRELPALDRLQAKFDKNDFVVIPVSIDRQPPEVTQQFTRQLALEHLNFYHDVGKQMGRIFPVDVVPANFIIDRNGKAVSFLRSFVDWDDELASDMVKFYLQQSGEETPLWHPPQLNQVAGEFSN